MYINMKAITAQENLRRIYNHECPEWIPTYRQECTGDPIPLEITERGPSDGSMAQMLGGDGYDWFGVRWVFQPSMNASTVDPKCPPILTDITHWEKDVKFPDLDAIDWAAASARYEKNFEPGKFRKMTFLNGPFERLHSLMGMEGAMCAMMEEPEATFDFFSAVAEHKIKLADKAITHFKPDCIEMHDDWGHLRNSFFSPKVFCELIVPNVSRIVEYCKARGVFYDHHSCGYITNLIPYMVEEIGIEAWSSAQSINDVGGIIRKYGSRLVVIGGCDYEILETADKEIAKAFLTKHIETYCCGGALIPTIGSKAPRGRTLLAEVLAEKENFFENPKNRVRPSLINMCTADSNAG
jgi:hypothetical protein